MFNRAGIAPRADFALVRPNEMETSLHAQLKNRYADGDQVEVRMDGFRIDAIRDDTLVEVQHGSLGAIRDKVRKLLKRHDVLVVKPIVARKRIVKCDAADGKVIHRRWSPKTGTWLDFFEDFVYFVTVFPHTRLSIEVVCVEMEEWRYPRESKRRRRRRNAGDYKVSDQRLLEVKDNRTIRTPSDLFKLLPNVPLDDWHTGDLAESLGVDRWIAQRIAYCLRETGAAKTVGKKRNTIIYRVA